MKRGIAKGLFVLAWLAIFFEVLTDTQLREHLFAFLKAHPFAAPIVLVALQTSLAALALPCSPLTVLAGLLWGVWLGLAYSTLATMCASLATFLLGRHVFRGWLLERMRSGWRRQVIVMIERFGWKSSALAHANPVFPGSSLGYCFGASNISLGAFWLGALAGNLPLQVLMVKAGDLTRDVAEGGATTGALIVMALIALSVAFYRIAAPAVLSGKSRSGEEEGSA